MSSATFPMLLDINNARGPETTMPPRSASCVIGIDVGGTNTDWFVAEEPTALCMLTDACSVILRGEEVIAWHKTPTTKDIQSGIETAIDAVVEKAKLETGRVDAVKIGTTVNGPILCKLRMLERLR